MSAIGKLFELERLPLGKRKKLYEQFLKSYSRNNKNILNDTRAEVWKRTKDKETLVRFTMLTSKLSISSRLREGYTETDVYTEISKLIKNRNFLSGLGSTGTPLESIVVREIQRAISPFTSSWKGEQSSHTGGARTKLWLNAIRRFIDKNNYDVLNLLRSFKCPTAVVSQLKKINFSSRDSAKFLALIAHPKLNDPLIPVCIPGWYPKHAKCFPPQINDEVTKFFFRTGCITIKSTERYHNRPETGFDVTEKDFVGASYPIFYGHIFDEFKNIADPALFAERVIGHCSDDIGICTEESPKCELCSINSFCALSKSKGENPEIVRATSSNTEFYSGRTYPKTSTGCRIK